MHQQFHDSLTSLTAGLGDVTRDKLAGSSYQYQPLSDVQLYNAYSSSWMVRKAVNIPAKDATRKWRTWQADKADTDAIVKLEKAFRVKERVAQAKILARLWGGAAIVIGDGEKDTTKPLIPERIKKGGLKYLAVMPRRELSASELDRDPSSLRFGEPKSYQFAGHETDFVEFHPSRLVIFKGTDHADPWTVMGPNYGWGDSVITSIYDAMRQGDSVLANVASLVFEANVDVIRFPNLMNMVKDSDYEQAFLKRMSLAATAKGINKTLIMDADEEYDRKSAQFGTLDKVIDQFLRVCAGAADIPMTRFLAQSAPGLSGTGEHDMKNYYDMISSMQEIELDGPMMALNEVIVRSALGAAPEDVTHTWRPLEQMSEKEQSEIGERIAKTVDTLISAGTHDAEEMRQAATPVLTDMGIFPGLSQIVEDADLENDTDTDEDDDAALLLPEGEGGVTDAKPRTLYVHRKVLNADDIVDWAKSQGFEVTLPADDLHVTVAFSRKTVDWMKIGQAWESELTVKEGGPRLVERFGEATVLLFGCNELVWRHECMIHRGASWDHEDYQPHITISYKAGDLDLDEVEPYQGEIKLGPEVFAEVKEEWQAGLIET